jgi:hypothetical protein
LDSIASLVSFFATRAALSFWPYIAAVAFFSLVALFTTIALRAGIADFAFGIFQVAPDGKFNEMLKRAAKKSQQLIVDRFSKSGAICHVAGHVTLYGRVNNLLGSLVWKL